MHKIASTTDLIGPSDDSPARGIETLTCLTCGAVLRGPVEHKTPFCAACAERSRKKNIDPLYDDLGGPG